MGTTLLLCCALLPKATCYKAKSPAAWLVWKLSLLLLTPVLARQ